jgi:hypothetical protein
MDRCVGAAARLPESERKDLAILALARSATVSDLAARHGVSRKFVYQQTHKAQRALDNAFMATTLDDAVLFELTVTKTWLRQVIVGLALICHSSYRGVVEFLRDLLGVAISVGTVHHVFQSATQRAGVINREQDLSGIRVGLHDEIFHNARPVLAGVDAHSTYCYLLAAEQHRDADTWGVHLLDAARQGVARLRSHHTLQEHVLAAGWETYTAVLDRFTTQCLQHRRVGNRRRVPGRHGRRIECLEYCRQLYCTSLGRARIRRRIRLPGPLRSADTNKEVLEPRRHEQPKKTEWPRVVIDEAMPHMGESDHEGTCHNPPHCAVEPRQRLPRHHPEDLGLRRMGVLADLAEWRKFLQPG